MLLKVELPKAEHMVVRVPPSILMTQLLSYLCERRNLDLTLHRFDLPVTEESLAQKTLQQLKINTIRVASRGALVRKLDNIKTFKWAKLNIFLPLTEDFLGTLT